jgi:uncharacterized protein YheU (UPF0270 family)
MLHRFPERYGVRFAGRIRYSLLMPGNDSNQKPKETQSPIEIPVARLTSEILDNIVREFVLREGTDYGSVEMELSTKLRQVHAQIKRGDVKIVFDPETESVTLMTKHEFTKLSR